MKKITKEIKINDNRIGKIIFKPDDNSIHPICKKIIFAVQKLKKFYKTDIKDISFEIIYSRKEFNRKIRKNTPSWLVGFFSGHKIYLVSSNIIEKISPHQKSDFKKILIHELCHYYNNKINKNMPIWINEGLALFLAGQKKKKPERLGQNFLIAKFFSKNINYWSFIENDGYSISYWLIKTIAEKFSKNQLKSVMKIGSSQNDKNKLEKILKMPI